MIISSAARIRLAAGAVAVSALMVSGLTAGSAGAVAPSQTSLSQMATAKAKCTTTPSGRCIKAGQFCAQRFAGTRGTDASGRRLTCKKVSGRYHWQR